MSREKKVQKLGFEHLGLVLGKDYDKLPNKKM